MNNAFLHYQHMLNSYIRIIPYAGLELTSFDQLKQCITPCGESGRLSSCQRLACGSAAVMIEVVLTYPLDMIRGRMAVQFHTMEYHSWRHAIKIIYMEEVSDLFMIIKIMSIAGLFSLI